MSRDKLENELIKKYLWAGKIRFICFVLLFAFLLLMKVNGGYTYLNLAFSSLILVEAVFNQPYGFLLRRVNLYRFQFYQMVVDIIAISWLFYYMGGLKAPIVTIAYYAVILWAGVVSDYSAVFFAVGASASFFIMAVLFEYYGILPEIHYLGHRLPEAQMYSLLFGNLAFLFAFGYFSAYSSRVLWSLQRKRQEESLKYTHRLLSAGYLLGAIAHDFLNHLMSVRGYAKLLLDKTVRGGPGSEEIDTAHVLKRMEEMEHESIELFARLSRFSRKQAEKKELININQAVAGGIELVGPLLKMSDISIEKALGESLPPILADNDQLSEVFVILLLNAAECTPKNGLIKVSTSYKDADKILEFILFNTGDDFNKDYLRRIAGPLLSEADEDHDRGLGLSIAEEIIKRYRGSMSIESGSGKGTKVMVRFLLV